MRVTSEEGMSRPPTDSQEVINKAVVSNLFRQKSDGMRKSGTKPWFSLFLKKMREKHGIPNVKLQHKEQKEGNRVFRICFLPFHDEKKTISTFSLEK